MTALDTRRTSLWRNGDFVSLWSAVGLANLGDGVFQVALPIVLIVHGSPASSVPLVLGAGRMPWAVFALHAGLLVDRSDRRVLLGASYALRGLAVTAIALAVSLRLPLVPTAVFAAFCVGVAETVGETAVHSVTPGIVTGEELVRANGLLQSTELTTNLLIGPTCAGLIAAVSPTAGLVVVGVLYVAAAANVRGLRRLPGRTDQQARPRLTDGLRYLSRSGSLRAYALAVGLLNLAYAIFQSVLPLKVVGGGAQGRVLLGLYWGASGVVCLVLGLLSPWLVRRMGARGTLLIGVSGLAFGFCVGGLSDDRWVLGAGVAATGVLVLVNVVTVSYRQSQVPSHLLGRVTAAYRLIAFGAFPIGSLVAGVCVGWFSLSTALLVTLVPTGIAGVLFGLTHLRPQENLT